jgi:cystathionine beta-lyase
MYAVQDRSSDDRFDDITIAELRGRQNAKWTMYGKDVLPAWVAEMDFPVARVIRDALHEAVEFSRTGYAPTATDTGLPQACAGWLSRRYGLDVVPSQIRILPNVLRGVELAIDIFTPPAGGVVVPTPSYPPFFETVRVAQRQIVEVPLITVGEHLTFDLDGIDAALAAGAGSVLLCNPHNPTGLSFSRPELAALANIVEAHGARVIADEVHAPLTYSESTHVAYATVSEAAAQHSVTITSASKGWNVPGLSCAQIALTNEVDTRVWDSVSRLRTGGGSVLGILANRIAYEEGEPWLQEAVAYLQRNRSLVAELLGRYLPRIRFGVPAATFLYWLDCTELGLDDPMTFFLKRARVALSDGAAFGAPGIGHVRFNFATSRAILRTIIERMAEAITDLPTQAP